MTKQIEAMRKLGLSEEEIQQVLADDKAIDRGVKLFELTSEQKQASKQSRQVSRAPGVYKLDNTAGKRSKKADDDKQFLIDALARTLATDDVRAENVNIVNPEREVEFVYHGRKFKIVLSAPRN